MSVSYEIAAIVPLMNAKTTHLKVTAELVRLIYKGVTLKDNDTIDLKKIPNKGTIHLFRKIFAISEEELLRYENLEGIQALTTGEDFQQLHSGLCLSSICYNSICRAKGKVILVAKGFGNFNMTEEIHNLPCPICKSTNTQEAISALLHLAKWRMIGYTNLGVRVGNWMLANKSGYKVISGSETAEWKEVIIEVSKLVPDELELDINVRPVKPEVGRSEIFGFTCVLSIMSPPEEGRAVRDSEIVHAKAGANIVCVIDESGSMNGDKMITVRESLTTFVNKIPQGDRVALVCFDTYANIRCHLTNDKNVLRQSINTLRARGNTNITAGITKAIEVLDLLSQSESASILLLTDGQDGGAYRSKEVIDRSRAVGKIFTLHTLGYGDDHDVKMMTSLAKYGKGSYTSVRESSNMEKAMALFIGAAISQFSHSILVRFDPSPDIRIAQVYGKRNVNSFSIPDLSFDNRKDIVFKIDLPAVSTDCTVALKGIVDYTLAAVSDSNGARRFNFNFELRRIEDSKHSDNISVLMELGRVETSVAIGEARRLASSGNFPSAIHVLDEQRTLLEKLPDSPQRTGFLTSLEDVRNKVKDLSSWKSGGLGILEDIEKNLMNQTASINVKLFMNSTQVKLLGEQQT